MNNNIKPSDFSEEFPTGSVMNNCESEIVASNIMTILKRTGNVFRILTWDEYKEERLKDGSFTEEENRYFINVIQYCLSPETAKDFCEYWNDIFIEKSSSC